MLMNVFMGWITATVMPTAPTMKMALAVPVTLVTLEMVLTVKILMSVAKELIHVMKTMLTALTLMVAIPVPVTLDLMERERTAVCTTIDLVT